MTEQTATTPAAAAEKLDSLIANPEFRTKLLASGAAETREFHELMAAKSGGDRLGQIIAGTAEMPLLETTMNGELSTYKIATTVADLRERGLDDATIRQTITGASVSKAEFDAVKRLHEDRLGDADWTSKLLKGAAKERREFTLMQVVLAGGYK
jgi:hypothetical protein